MENEKHRIFVDKNGHAWVGEHWFGQPPSTAIKVAKVPLQDDPRWIQGAPSVLDTEVLTLSPFYPSGRLGVTVELKKSDPLVRYANHPPFFGAKAWMPLDRLHWVDVARQQEIDITIRRIARGEKGDDLPCVMADLGCDYEAACDAVFGGNIEAALDLMAKATQPVLETAA